MAAEPERLSTQFWSFRYRNDKCLRLTADRARPSVHDDILTSDNLFSEAEAERGPPPDHHHTPVGIDSTLENGSGEKQNNAAACLDGRRRSTG